MNENDDSQTNEHNYENEESMLQENNVDETKSSLHYFMINLIHMSCLETGLNALHLSFLTIHNAMHQSDNTKKNCKQGYKAVSPSGCPTMSGLFAWLSCVNIILHS